MDLNLPPHARHEADLPPDEIFRGGPMRKARIRCCRAKIEHRLNVLASNGGRRNEPTWVRYDVCGDHLLQVVAIARDFRHRPLSVNTTGELVA